jgi:uncharacterized protein (TIGR00661 family)
MSKKVLVAPLDWGLGHATRCIPVIQELLNRNCEVFIASSGSALELLRKEFPDIRFFKLRPYRVKYPEGRLLVLSLFSQVPRIRGVISKEHKQLEQLVLEHNIDLVISDNRYGCWSARVPSIFIGHQLSIQLPGVFKLFQPIVNLVHHRMIRKFSEVWIPDEKGELNLTGKLSEANVLRKYIGILSRFKKASAEFKYDIAVILSGPEPQRTLLEGIIFDQIRNQEELKIIVVRGVVEGEGNWKQVENFVIVNFLQSRKLEEIINQSKLIISRSGYSTIMDLARLGKKAIFVPTPGQTEQEYLARRLMDKQIVYYSTQKDFDLTSALVASEGFSGFSNIEQENGLLLKALDEVLK